MAKKLIMNQLLFASKERK